MKMKSDRPALHSERMSHLTCDALDSVRVLTVVEVLIGDVKN